VVPPEDREAVKVNNASLTELKNACDDALKRFLSRPELFKQIHHHTDIRLALGWLSVLVAGGTALYGYKIEFEKSKPVVWVGVLCYVILTTLQTLYTYFVQKDTVFVGKRKTFSKRIITERLVIGSRTIPAKKIQPPPSDSSSPKAIPPVYSISLSYNRSASSGKSLLARGKTGGSRPYVEFFDEKGTLNQEKLEKWIGELVEDAMEGKTS
jgi:signal peptidase complex subunit 2